jgi:hypothetical protein
MKKEKTKCESINVDKPKNIKVRMVEGPADGKVVEAGADVECVQWCGAPPISPCMLNTEKPAPSPVVEIHNYWRKDFAYRFSSGKTLRWRVMVHEPDVMKWEREIDECICGVFDSLFGPSINGR